MCVSENHTCNNSGDCCHQTDVIQDILAEIDLIKQRLAYYAVPKLADAVAKHCTS